MYYYGTYQNPLTKMGRTILIKTHNNVFFMTFLCVHGPSMIECKDYLHQFCIDVKLIIIQFENPCDLEIYN